MRSSDSVEEGFQLLMIFRPWSFDSWNGGSADELNKAAVGGGGNLPKNLKNHIFPSIMSTEKCKPFNMRWKVSFISIGTITIMFCVIFQDQFWVYV